MPALKVCRICLGSKVKLFKYDRHELKSYYEEIMGSNINVKDGLPYHFCYECAALLHKFHNFKEKCHIGQKVLKELKWNGPITLKSIHNVDRQKRNLKSSIDIMTANHRVRTIIIKSRSKKKSKKKDEIMEIEMVTTAVSDDDEFIDNIEEDRDELAPLPELINVQEDIIDKDVETINVIEEKYNIPEEKVTVDEDDIKLIEIKQKIEEIKTPIEKASDDEKLPDDDDDYFVNDLIIVTEDDKPKSKKAVAKRKKNTKKKKKEKEIDDEEDFSEKKSKNKFEQNAAFKKYNLDPKNWLKYNMNEDEALAEFKLKGEAKRYTAAEFKCHDCYRGFSKEDMLIRHAKIRHCESLGQHECRFCHMRFKWKSILRRHMRQHYTKFKCLRCDLVCSLETTAQFHEDYHNGVIRKCAHCGEEFKHLTTYYTHLRSHRSEHVCKLCGASFVSAMGLKIHKKVKHFQGELENIEDVEGEKYCQTCDIKFETVNAYKEHLIHSAKHSEGLEELAPGVNPRKRTQILKRLQRIPTTCHICGKHFLSQSACRKHHLAEHPRAPAFAPSQRQICEICGISLAPTSVYSHLNTHTKEKTHSCSTCGKRFTTKGTLTIHQLTHTREKPVECTLCDKRFTQVSSMKLHYRTYHLKEPYPKRNRKKKTDEIPALSDQQTDSEENMALVKWL